MLSVPTPRPRRRAALLPLLALAACHWLMPYEHVARDAATDAPPDAPPDARPPDAAPDATLPDAPLPVDLPPPVDAPLCTAAGRPADCDPFAPKSCPTPDAWCYLVAGQGPSCVCPTAGALGEGMACMTSVDCLPGLVCRGVKPPGVCRPVCNPGDASSCPLPSTCIAITEVAGIDPLRYGFCDPR